MNKENIRLVQLIHLQHGRRVAMVKEPLLLLLNEFASVYQLALEALDKQEEIEQIIVENLSAESLHYAVVYTGDSDWKLLPSFDHPVNPFACMVSGTGLTHKNSALNRQAMHQAEEGKLTDSMQIYQWGASLGHPQAGSIGVQPEWFYKGTGSILKGHGDWLETPAYANDGGEEPEIAGIYVVDKNGHPRRIGFTPGNEFSDHVMEKKNYLYLAPSKLRNCSIGPEIIINAEFDDVHGEVSIERNGAIIWQAAINTGEKNMSHSIENLEHHHFKYAAHRVPYQAHIHFFGADAFSFGNQVTLQEADIMSVSWNGFGRPLKNKLTINREEELLVKVGSI
jgi:hypothetical protein